jgi:hypothetical protein
MGAPYQPQALNRFCCRGADNVLRLGKINFQLQFGTPWSLGTHQMIFLHDNLESLTIVAAEISTNDVIYLKHHKRLTKLSHLHLDHCDVSPKALGIILSVPRALISLVLTEYDYRSLPKYYISSDEQLEMALSPQIDSLRDLYLGLRFQQQSFPTPYDFSNFTSLQKLILECRPLDNRPRHSLVLTDRTLQISELDNITVRRVAWVTFPERPMCLVLQTPPGYRLTASDTQRDIERLGRSLRITHDAVVQPQRAFEIRLMVVRQTEQKGAVPPYLYNEHVPEKVICYDSFASTPNWDFKTKAELESTLERGIEDLVPNEMPLPDSAPGEPSSGPT